MLNRDIPFKHHITKETMKMSKVIPTTDIITKTNVTIPKHNINF